MIKTQFNLKIDKQKLAIILKKFIVTVALSGVIFGCSAVLIVKTQYKIEINKEIKFQDANLENAVRSIIKKPTGTIYSNDFATIDSLELAYSNITNLSGIEKIPNLKHLSLSNNQILNIDIIKSLVSLEYLDLQYNPLSDITSMSNLTNLKELKISYTNVKDISSLNKLKKLETLFIDSINITDINNLSNIRNLKFLSARLNSIEDISWLSKLTNLNSVYLGGNKIQDISALKNLHNLEQLFLDGNKIENIDILVNNKKLTNLILDSNPIKNFSLLSTMKHLTNLSLSNTDLFSLKDLKNIPELSFLTVDSCGLKDISDISEMKKLQFFSFKNNMVSDISPIYKSGITDLNMVNLACNPILDYSAIKGMYKKLQFAYYDIDKEEEAVSKAKNIVAAIIKPDMSELQKEKEIYNYLIKNTEYNYDGLNNFNEDDHTAYGALITGKCVCEGYADAMQKMFTIAGIECYVVDGLVGENIHDWNIVKISGKYYHVDATWGDTGYSAFEFFNISDNKIGETRIWSPYGYPKCN